MKDSQNKRISSGAKSEVVIAVKNDITSAIMRFSVTAQLHTGIALNPRIVAFIGALLPGISCYLCVAYTFVFQGSSVENYTTIDCPGIARSTGSPPVSYSIETEPQKYFWLIIMFLHLPFRLMYPIIYSRLFRSIRQKRMQTWWFQTVHFLYFILMFGEIIGLVSLTIFEMHTGFYPHATAFVIWIISFNGNTIGGSILHGASGIWELNPRLKLTFYMKLTAAVLVSSVTVIMTFAYIYSASYCFQSAYVYFVLTEYILVGLNSAFHFLLFWEYKWAADGITNINSL